MRQVTRTVMLTLGGLVLGASDLFAHPGHALEGGPLQAVRHMVASPYHVAVVVGIVAVVAAWTSALRPAPRVRAAREGRQA
jgi:hypothetical protein